jgi:UDP-3-O-[3-hydroxymyristoyl] glucosamine N-acyltransferase
MPQAGVTGSLPARSVVGGSPAKPRKEMLNSLMQVKRIKSLAATIKQLAERLAKLEQGQ